ncbi:MAG: LemA family protein [Anaerovoracaceae bacterium]
MNTLGSVLIVAAVVAFIVVFWMITVSNRINRYQVMIQESKRTVDIALAKRYDVLSDLCETVKKFTAYESEIMGQLITVRQGGSIADTNAVIENQNQVLRQVYAVGENYPELRSSTLYANLQAQIAEQNEYLAAAKRTVNSNISLLNQLAVTFPSSIVAGMKGCVNTEFLREENLEMKKNASVANML